MSIVSKKLEWLSLLTPVGETPVEQLQRVTPILNAIGAQAIIVVEDIDRTGQKFNVRPVFALLAQIARSGRSILYTSHFSAPSRRLR